jgi:prolyl oligopeptidase
VPEEWAFLKQFSPYHNNSPAKDTPYPPCLVTTSTRDDRVHPAHARKMVAKLQDMGHGDIHFENIEGGHDGKQVAFMQTLQYGFLYKTIGRTKQSK